ncbi:MAG: DUF1311 domain-containing protein [Puniceicoccales bacterium]|jgi:hypothetical protein|nr:DUF1311 domain-containing protein [Puniceicoccales bacterium]
MRSFFQTSALVLLSLGLGGILAADEATQAAPRTKPQPAQEKSKTNDATILVPMLEKEADVRAHYEGNQLLQIGAMVYSPDHSQVYTRSEPMPMEKIKTIFDTSKDKDLVTIGFNKTWSGKDMNEDATYLSEYFFARGYQRVVVYYNPIPSYPKYEIVLDKTNPSRERRPLLTANREMEWAKLAWNFHGARTQTDMNLTSYALCEFWERELTEEEIYQQEAIGSSMDSAFVSEFQKAQKEWRIFRTSEVSRKSNWFRGVRLLGSSIRNNTYCKLTKERLRELRLSPDH